MNNQPSFDRGLLIPIGVGIFSLIGICVLLVMGQINSSRAVVEEVPTASPFKYSLIGTEPALPIFTLDASAEAPGTTTPGAPRTTTLPATIPVFSTNTSASVVPIITLPATTVANTPTRTPTSASAAPLGPGTYDDMHDRLIYSDGWDESTGVGVHQGTLHVSDTIGSSVSFRFIGQEIRVFFQAGPSLGSVRLTLDGATYDISQANSSTQIYEWALPRVTNGTHTVTITHISGGSVNLDSIIIPDVPVTPTVTISPTPLNQ